MFFWIAGSPEITRVQGLSGGQDGFHWNNPHPRAQCQDGFHWNNARPRALPTSPILQGGGAGEGKSPLPSHCLVDHSTTFHQADQPSSSARYQGAGTGKHDAPACAIQVKSEEASFAGRVPERHRERQSFISRDASHYCRSTERHSKSGQPFPVFSISATGARMCEVSEQEYK